MTHESQMSRRRVIKGALAVAGSAALVKTGVVGGVSDALDLSGERLREQKRKRLLAEGREIEAKDKQRIADAIRFNEAKMVGQVTTDSGMRFNIMQAQTGWNPDIKLGVDAEALNKSIMFMLDAMNDINDVNGQPFKPERIAAMQRLAHLGQLGHIETTVIMSATTGFHDPEGVLRGGGAALNSHPFTTEDPRQRIHQLIAFSPDIYRPDKEIATPRPVAGIFGDNTSHMPRVECTPSLYMTAFFAHEMGHVLTDALGSDVFYRDVVDGGYEREQLAYEHKRFVSPLSWYHMAALTGNVAGVPRIPPALVVPKI